MTFSFRGHLDSDLTGCSLSRGAGLVAIATRAIAVRVPWYSHCLPVACLADHANTSQFTRNDRRETEVGWFCSNRLACVCSLPIPFCVVAWWRTALVRTRALPVRRLPALHRLRLALRPPPRKLLPLKLLRIRTHCQSPPIDSPVSCRLVPISTLDHRLRLRLQKQSIKAHLALRRAALHRPLHRCMSARLIAFAFAHSCVEPCA